MWNHKERTGNVCSTSIWEMEKLCKEYFIVNMNTFNHFLTFISQSHPSVVSYHWKWYDRVTNILGKPFEYAFKPQFRLLNFSLCIHLIIIDWDIHPSEWIERMKCLHLPCHEKITCYSSFEQQIPATRIDYSWMWKNVHGFDLQISIVCG